MSTERTDGPWLVIAQIDGDYESRITGDLSEVERELQSARDATDGNGTVIVIPLRVAVAAPEMLKTLGDCTSALQLYDGHVMDPTVRKGWTYGEGFRAWKRATVAIASTYPGEGEE